MSFAAAAALESTAQVPAAPVPLEPIAQTGPEPTPMPGRSQPDPASMPGRSRRGLRAVPSPEDGAGCVPATPPSMSTRRAGPAQPPARLPAPARAAGEIALALLEVEAGWRSAGQLERVCSPEAWAGIHPRLRRRGGQLPTRRTVLRIHCQEQRHGMADLVVVVRRGPRVLPVAMRLEGRNGRWTVTELVW